MKVKTVYDCDFNDKVVILRAELDVPIVDGIVESDSRLKANLSTINHLLANGARQVLIIGHLGRPNGVEQDKSLKPVHKKLEELIVQEIGFIKDFNISRHELPHNKKIILFENTRFFVGEKTNDEDFAKKIATLGDVFVNNCFSTMTREHASITGIAKILPSFAGLRVIEELEALSIENKESPKVLILGGAKMETKLPIIKEMLGKVDKILLGSATVIDLLKSKGVYRGKVIFDYPDMEELTKIADNEKIVYPLDFACSKTKSAEGLTYKKVRDVESDDYVFDIGPSAILSYKKILASAKTIIWNGPLGYYEVKEFAKSSEDIAKFISTLDAFTLIGGGDTEEILKEVGVEDKINHICVGGGSMLKLLAGDKLPGLEVLKR